MSVELAVTEETVYEVNLETYKIYGFHIDGSESSPSGNISYAVQYNGKNVENYGYTAASMNFSTGVINPGSWNLTDDFFVPRSCMLKNDGTVDYYLSESDETKKADGVTAGSRLFLIQTMILQQPFMYPTSRLMRISMHIHSTTAMVT